MSRAFSTATIFAVAYLIAATAGVGSAEKWNVFGVQGEQCTAPVSIDGDLAAMEDQDIDRLYVYDFKKNELRDTGIVERNSMPNIKGQLVAYQTTQPYDPVLGYGTGISIYSIATGNVTATPITTADRRNWWDLGRYFDGEKIVFTDLVDGHVKIYWLVTGTITDIGIKGDAPTVDGDFIAFEMPIDWWSSQIALYDIVAGQLRIVDEGRYPTLGGSIISYYEKVTFKLKYYEITSDTVFATALPEVYTQKTDGKYIAAQIRGGPIVLVDVKTGNVKDTKHHGCGSSDACWIEISGKYVAYERYEGGTDERDPDTGLQREVYPPSDYNGNGIIKECVGFWFKL